MGRVLFVCIRNTARSVAAEAIFNSLARVWKAESAGIERGESIDPVMKKLLTERGFRVKSVPRSLDDVDLDSYDLVVVVCDAVCVRLDARAVEYWEIKDPAGRDEKVYAEVIREIEDKVRGLVSRLES